MSWCSAAARQAQWSTFQHQDSSERARFRGVKNYSVSKQSLSSQHQTNLQQRDTTLLVFSLYGVVSSYLSGFVELLL